MLKEDMSRTKSLKKTSIWEVDAVASCVKPVHRHRIWNYLIHHMDTQKNEDTTDKSWHEVLPYDSWSVPRAARDAIAEKFVHFTTKVVERQDSARGDTTKLLIQLQDGHLIETVIMQHHHYRTVCLSSQIGCKMGCKFCATGTMGIIGNLTAGEILEQVVHANAISKIRNIVFMGMGEPMNNMDALCTSLDFLVDTRLFSLSPRHITVSTVGVVKNMRRLTDEYPTVNLALSLHAPNQEVRLKIVPSASAHKYEDLMLELAHRIAAWTANDKGYKLGPAQFGEAENSASDRSSNKLTRNFKKHVNGAGVMIEYILIKDINVLPEHAHELGKVLSSRREEVLLNLIPYNPTDIAEDFEPPTQESIDEFVRILISDQYRIHTRVRHEKGQDIDGACGQLVVQTNKKNSKAKSVDIEDTVKGGKKSNRRTELGGTSSVAKGQKYSFLSIHGVVTVASIGMFAVSAIRGA